MRSALLAPLSLLALTFSLCMTLLVVHGASADQVDDQVIWAQVCDPGTLFSTNVKTGETSVVGVTANTNGLDMFGVHASSRTLYWAYYNINEMHAYIAKASLDGSKVNTTWADAGGSRVYSMTVSGDGTVYYQGGGRSFFRVEADGSSVELGTFAGNGGGGMNGGVVVVDNGATGYFGADDGTFPGCVGGIEVFGIAHDSATAPKPFNCTTGKFPRRLAAVGSNLLALSDQNTPFMKTVSRITGEVESFVSLPGRAGGITATPEGSSIYAITTGGVVRADAPRYAALTKVADFPSSVSPYCIGGGAAFIPGSSSVHIDLISPSSGPIAGGTVVFAVLSEPATSSPSSCVFGTLSSPATLVAPQIVSCISPKAAAAGKVSFAVEIDGLLSNADATVVVVGGYGVFGSRLVARLTCHEGLRVVVAGRSKDDAQRLVDDLQAVGDKNIRDIPWPFAGPDASWRAVPKSAEAVRPDVLSPQWYMSCSKLEAAALDATAEADVLAKALKELRCGQEASRLLVVNTSGPYRATDEGYALARACAAADVHYLDLADSRVFVAGFDDNVPVSEKAMIRTAGSTVSALSTALADAVEDAAGPGWALADVDYFIGVGHQGPRGLGTIRSVLEYCGKKFSAFRDGTADDATEIGWGSLSWRGFHGLATPRLVAPVSVPDIDAFPMWYPNLRNHRFAASLELPVVMAGMRVLAWVRSALSIESYDRLAPALAAAAKLLSPFGSPDGGMHMRGTLVDTTGERSERPFEASLIGQAGYGPDTPVVAAELAALQVRDAARAARPLPPHMLGTGLAGKLFSLDQFRALLDGAGAPFSWRLALDDEAAEGGASANDAGAAHAFTRAMGADEISAMPPALRAFHDTGGKVRGALTVTRNKAMLNNLVTTLGMLPKDSGGEAVAVEVTSENGLWHRKFFSGPPSKPGKIMSQLKSVWSLMPRSAFNGASGVVFESFYGGLMKMAFHVSPLGDRGADGFRHTTKGMFLLWGLVRIPFPLMLRGDGYSLAHPDGRGWYVKVDIDAPIIGRLVSYEGDVQGGTLTLTNPAFKSHRQEEQGFDGGADAERTFVFDKVYWSYAASEDDYAGQEMVFDELGSQFLDAAFAGYNSSVFAYGQTGSGKTYSMMGMADDPGLIPRTCAEIFARAEAGLADGSLTKYSVEVSYLEIYMESIKDLLNPGGGAGGGRGKGPGGALVVREHARFGVFVPGLEKLVAASSDDVVHFLELGSKERTVAATKMNNSSSRSHAVFTVYLTTEAPAGEGGTATLRAKMNLVDLAGSENQNNTGAKGTRLKEACAINKSLSALGNVISALTSKSRSKRHIPYRDSVLTRLLQESLGGNAKAIMLVAISPASSNYAQTYSTLSFAERAKKIVNSVSRNKTSNQDMVKALKAEVERLKTLLEAGGETTREPVVEELQRKLDEQNAIIAELKVTDDERRERTSLIVLEREELLASQGISLRQLGSAVGKQSTPYLVNLNPDPELAASLVYYLRPGRSTVGASADVADIVIAGLRVLPAHCVLDVSLDSGASITPLTDALTYVNGHIVRDAATPLTNGCRIILGKSVVFRYISPLDAEPLPEFGWDDAVREMSLVLGIGGGSSAGHGGTSRSPGAEPVDPRMSLLAEAAILADEGNDLARAMQRPVMFSPDLEPAVGGDDVISIRCCSMVNGRTIVVTLAEFKQRIEAMYKLYAEAGLGDDKGLVEDEVEFDDPFSIHAADQLVGSGRLSLEPLLKGHAIDELVEIVSEDGAAVGRLHVRVAVLEAATYKPMRQVPSFAHARGTEIIFVLDIVGAHSVESPANSGMFVRFTSLFPEEDVLNVTERGVGPGNAPKFGFRERYVLVLDDEVYDVYREEPMLLELWGRNEVVDSVFAGVDLGATDASIDTELMGALQSEVAELRSENAIMQTRLGEAQASVASQKRIITSLRHQLEVLGARKSEPASATPTSHTEPVEVTVQGSDGDDSGSSNGEDGAADAEQGVSDSGCSGESRGGKKSRTCAIQ
ncbi:uncharacterized protein AMSG_12292 [Thecamonas trahens ATCC 50062]|uniref:Kinesin motor domain-containing protein n=1 Tax=Thecamonas trahens ATCC 50062 TaxID=461836 RepID=A0A0L0DNN0_THETB|nr:hypothetical protein AMSG_12292 [Thecamonas trahens ATCC 50062]KNC53875.1 hypothetical protein AMSG_12292 [Thecamonas trahens ATCC 50062]|eukprot:XP_013754285.1 hypothetical protein AMSG_12292 [Thecamonas trahens ATCC 50062]